ncbi:hypothetical protein HCN44_001524 [Aphidius gifuensis]|uniref:Arginyl-tRNA--protein transferase 1 n=1 Tax=Aphidius gifuensis TaxID=684658 RepID=A0A834XW11_APHGI|nr:arginyl-tRNA--protein transferase 1 isoform X2 [Aphidius gifuensis]KAF7992199.1 hypothetical protein HCN44_001524 [Aphidius gifuensis]
METPTFSVVEFYYNEVPVKRKCGYCKSTNGSQRDGMWAHTLTVQDYQNLIDRGWRRSGSYCYKPANDQSCCPLYTIRCEALNFTASKSNKKIIKKMTKFLLKDDKTNNKINNKNLNVINNCDIIESEFHEHKNIISQRDDEKNNIFKNINIKNDDDDNKLLSNDKPSSSGIIKIDNNTQINNNDQDNNNKNNKKIFNPLKNDNLIKKAKLIRIERARKRLLSKGKSIEEIDEFYSKKKQKNSCKSIEELLATVVGNKNKLELKLVRVSTEEFMETLDESVALFEKYQIAIHNDPDDCDKNAFLNFLGKSPLQHYAPESGPPLGYGSFHQQYWLNDKLMAVGVIDILPSCISSVYFFYDPEYSFLSLGTYSSFVEIKLVRELNKTVPDLKYYYMGYYIHTIPKMKYKAKMKPSSLLCPETYIWCDINRCLTKLDLNKYSRFNDDDSVIDENGQLNTEDIMKVRCYYGRRRFYEDVQTIRRMTSSEINDIHEIRAYAKLVGKKCAHSMCLYLAQ